MIEWFLHGDAAKLESRLFLLGSKIKSDAHVFQIVITFRTQGCLYLGKACVNLPVIQRFWNTHNTHPTSIMAFVKQQWARLLHGHMHCTRSVVLTNLHVTS